MWVVTGSKRLYWHMLLREKSKLWKKNFIAHLTQCGLSGSGDSTNLFNNKLSNKRNYVLFMFIFPFSMVGVGYLKLLNKLIVLSK